MSHLPIWYLGELPSEVCDKIVSELLLTPSQDASMGPGGENKAHNTRNTRVHFAPENYWLHPQFEKFAREADTACGWGYNITSKELIQFAEYNVDQHYDWHTDTFTLSGLPTDRKVTVVTLLNDDFTGGHFDLKLYSEYRAPLKKGTMIAFPSILEHRVTPVESGVRYSATMWLNGPRFR